MNKLLIYQALEDPIFLSSIPMEELEKISAAYPWFMTAQVLLAKSYQQHNDHRFTDQLHQAAIYTGDRRMLYEYIKKEMIPPATSQEISFVKTKTPAEKEILSVTTPQIAIEYATDTAENIAENVAAEPPETIAENIAGNVATELPETIADTLKETMHVLKMTDENPSPPVDFSAPETTHFDPLDLQIVAAAVNSSIQSEVSEFRDTDSAESISAPDGILANDDENALEGYIHWVINRAKQVHYAQVEKEKNTQPAPDTSTSFSEEKIVVKPISSGVPDINKKEASTAAFTGRKKSQYQQLIDRFIQNDPKITPGRITEFIPGNFAKDSLEEDIDMVTETMAQLYAAQGRIDKARKAYKKLMEQYPEKSIYFAAQLKKIIPTKKG